MGWQTNKSLIAMRRLARKTGLSKIIGKMIARSRYEGPFDDAMFDRLGARNVVWDVGANVGY